MSKVEKEIKVLDIDIKETQEKLKEIGANFVEKSIQKLFTYDTPTIYHRYKEIKILINSEDNIMQEVNKEKFINLAYEIFDLFSKEEENLFFSLFEVSSLSELEKLNLNDLATALQNQKVDDLFSKFLINENKWIRLRQTNDKTTLTVKHIFDKKVEDIQYVKECEILVNDLNETNELLSKLGLVSRNYQEKRRTSYTYKTAEIEIDEWPLLKPYMEIESDDEDVIQEILEGLGYTNKKIVSTNTAALYKEIGIDVLKQKNLKFSEKHE